MQENFNPQKNNNEQALVNQKNNDIHQHLKEYLSDFGKEYNGDDIEIFSADNLPERYKSSYDFFDDPRLKDVKIAVIPEHMWHKGRHSSESHADKQLIIFNEEYFNDEKNADKIAWMVHELGHCQKFLDSESPEEYEKEIRTDYPNNKVEEHAFGMQIKYLKKKGVSSDDILEMLDKSYDDADMAFFKKIVDKEFG